MSIYTITIKLFGIPVFTIEKSWDQKVNNELTTLVQSLQNITKDSELSKLETV